MVVTLIGYRGSGKTSVAAPLAERLGWDWLDADAIIEQVAGKSIRQIFADSGEPEFRTWERAVLVELLQRENLVLAAGGGAILNADTRVDMRRAGPVVWLTADIETLWARISKDTTTAARRPNLTAQGGMSEVAVLLSQREPLYRGTATIIIETAGLDVPAIVERIWDQLPATLKAGTAR